MNIEIKNDLENDQMIVSVSVEKKKFSRDTTETFMWKNVLKLLEGYIPPNGYELGNCEVTNQKVDNNYDDRLHRDWTFELVKKASAKNPKKSTAATKKAASKQAQKSEA